MPYVPHPAASARRVLLTVLQAAPRNAPALGFPAHAQDGSSLAAPKLLVESGLSLSALSSTSGTTAWLTDAAGPVAAATVHVYALSYSGPSSLPGTGPDPVLLGSCTTDADGVCSVPSAGMPPEVGCSVTCGRV
jgi:hypothetical protein